MRFTENGHGIGVGNVSGVVPLFLSASCCLSARPVAPYEVGRSHGVAGDGYERGSIIWLGPPLLVPYLDYRIIFPMSSCMALFPARIDQRRSKGEPSRLEMLPPASVTSSAPAAMSHGLSSSS